MARGLGDIPKLRVILIILAIGAAACSPNKHDASHTAAHKVIAGTSAGGGHTPNPVRQVPNEGLFHGWMCDFDCSTHQAGYTWGQQHKIANPNDCRGPSQSFIEGCWAFAGVQGPFGQSVIFQDED